MSLECPESVTVGDEIEVTVRHVDDGARFCWSSGDGASGQFVSNEDPADACFEVGLPPEEYQLVFRADTPGTVEIASQEILIGPPICFPPYPALTTVSCSILVAPGG
jgi:hypothetical protein